MDRAESSRVGFEKDAFASRTGRRDPIAADVDADEAKGRNEMLFDWDLPPGPAAFACVRTGVGRVNAQTANGHVAEFQNVTVITKLIPSPRGFQAFVRKFMQERRRVDCSSG